MVVIIGGAYQGKFDYAKQEFPDRVILNEFHLFILELLKEGKDPYEQVKNNLENYKEKVIVCDDISCGVVPVDEIDRAWREAVGRCLALLSKNANQVIRVFCGIGTRLK